MPKSNSPPFPPQNQRLELLGGHSCVIHGAQVFGVAGGALECSMDSGSPVTPEYAPPFEFTGEIDSVTVDVSGELIRDTEAEMRQIMARQ